MSAERVYAGTGITKLAATKKKGNKHLFNDMEDVWGDRKNSLLDIGMATFADHLDAMKLKVKTSEKRLSINH